MDVHICSNARAVATTAAQLVADHVRYTLTSQEHFSMAISGGNTPRRFLTELRTCALDWTRVHLFQVDERIAPAGHPDRNLGLLQETLLDTTPPLPVHVYPMPVEGDDPGAACATYADQLCAITGAPPVLDLIQLGLGSDGHTASLVPGDSALDSTVPVTVSRVYQGRQRLTLTYPVLNRARCVLWVITGKDKRAMLTRLYREDRTIPAGRVQPQQAILVADQVAAEGLESAGS